MQETLGKQFDAQQQMRELEVAAIETKLKKLREIITKRNDARRTIIDKRFEQLLREAESLGWNSPSVGPAVYGHRTSFVPQSGGYYAPRALPEPPSSLPAPRRK